MHPFNAVVVWLALDDINEENGCVEALPGTHWRDVPHLEVKESFFPFAADEKYFDANAKTEKLICKAGQFFIFNERIIHKSGINNSANTRTALVGRFAGTNVYIQTPKAACIVISGEDRYGYNQHIKMPSEL